MCGGGRDRNPDQGPWVNRRLRDLNSCEPLRGIAWYGLKRALPDRRHAREYERQRRAPVPLDRVMPYGCQRTR